jgi:hypothetical protein
MKLIVMLENFMPTAIIDKSLVIHAIYHQKEN